MVSSRIEQAIPRVNTEWESAIRAIERLRQFLLAFAVCAIAISAGSCRHTRKSAVGGTAIPELFHLDTAYVVRRDTTISIESLRPRRTKAIDAHEHVASLREAERLLWAMDRFGIQRTVLVGSSSFTLTRDLQSGFVGYEKNNEEIIAAKHKWPTRFAAFVTLDPSQPAALERLKEYVRRGADGLKLYLGHGATLGTGEPFHVFPLDDSRMEPIWLWVEQVQLPVVLHVNLGLYWDELLRLMEKHPYLRINMPHLGLYKNTDERLARLGFLLKRYPFLYCDVSFGDASTQLNSFEELARRPTTFVRFLRTIVKRFSLHPT